MQAWLAFYRRWTEENGRSIPGLDGLRALFVLLVAGFHIWQQSWLTPQVKLFNQTYSMDAWLRTGYLWVDAMLLLSGFLLFLPYAEAAFDRKPLPGTALHYKKRFWRIVPSYYLCVLLMLLLIALPYGMFVTVGDMAKDVLAHLLFVFNFFPQTYHQTPLNGALWTVAVEVQFYLVFPLLARAFVKRPGLSYGAMVLAAWAFRAAAAFQNDLGMWINQMPAFLDVYANGFLGAVAYVTIKKQLKDSRVARALFTFVGMAAAMSLYFLLDKQAGAPDILHLQRGQMLLRYPLSVGVLLLVLSVPRAARPLRFVFSNPVTAYLSAVSYWFYMVHQVFAVQLKRWGIPRSESLSPHQAMEAAWQVPYVWLCLLGALALATAFTYLFERPLRRRFLKGR